MGQAFIVRRGGGTSLNLRIVGGTTRPTTNKENTIWVNTGADITGWTFEAKEPSNPYEGMVWLENLTGSGIEFNALAKNGIYVYPASAKQYVSGAWSAVDVEIYINGSWTSLDFDIVVYRDGVEDVAVTGGWSSSGTVTNNADKKRLEFRGKVTAASNNRIDLSGFSTLAFIASNDSGANSKFGVGTTATTFVASKSIEAYKSSTEYSLDISSLDDAEGYYLLVNTASTSNPTSFTEIILYK